MAKVLCLWHNDTDPSMHVYANGCHCFVCGTSVTHDEYALKAGSGVVLAPKPVVKADLEKGLQYVRSLPLARIRGLDLPADDKGYFIVWPGGVYYKKRLYGDGVRYLCPSGHRQPLLVASEGLQGRTLLIVEGELNALSIAAAIPELGVCSPGGAGDFPEPQAFYLNYRRQVLVADEDEAGARACIELSKALKQKSSDVQILLMKKKKHGGNGDANEIYQEKGKQALREEVLKSIRLTPA